MKLIDEYIKNHVGESIEALKRLVEIPSVSALGSGQAACAELVSQMLRERGFSTRLLGEESGAPVVFGELRGTGERTLLIYNHYDVQPAEPLELWESPPFQPAIRDGKLYGRGVNDDKGHFANRLLAIDALLSQGELPCTIKWVIEGEEETTSANLTRLVNADPAPYAADACVWEFGQVDDQDRPIQHLGLRGICYVELSVETANQDMHSGIGGSIMHNAAWRLVWALRSIKGQDENVRISGFYNKVKPVSAATRLLLDALPDEGPALREQYGVSSFLKGLTGGAPLRLAQAHEPSCTICGLESGYQGPGAKTVQPSRASAKLDFRLVPDQDPDEIFELLRAHLDRNDFEDVHIELIAKERPAVTSPDDPFVRMVVESAVDVYGSPMQVVPSIGGSGPNALFLRHHGFPIVTAGVGHPSMQMHAPNENLRLDLYEKGAKHMARIITRFASHAD